MLKLFQDCPLKYKTRIEGEWVGQFRSGALGFGKAVHEGLKEWYQRGLDGEPPSLRLAAALDAIEVAWPENHPVDDYRTLVRAKSLMMNYAKEYPSEPFKILLVEVPFKFHLGRYLLYCQGCNFENNPIAAAGYPRNNCGSCGRDLEEIEYGGIFDTLIQFGPPSSTIVYTLEHKTTSQLGSLYFRQYDLDNQVSGYVWGASQVSGKVVGGAMMNALCCTSGGTLKFDRQLISRTPTDLERWKNDVASTCNDIERTRRLGHWRMHTNHCMNKYGMCEYHSVHILSNPDEQRRRLETDYRKDPWDFERRDDVLTESV
jgi:hypothetical protein